MLYVSNLTNKMISREMSLIHYIELLTVIYEKHKEEEPTKSKVHIG